ncbi:hypothetical protein CQW23_31274 [Capsicum baccatum]|uniref:Uncharacterized protein n=1 Tax=Capsicum baccatum TaxID=33114 RepID=A0A2G2V8A0_CAPBA|nr:hypothetical protein CQW23_31274 [Capsicum baccatum]
MGVCHALKHHPFSGLVDSAVILTKNGPLEILGSVVRLNEEVASSYLFKDRLNGEPTGQRPERAMPKHTRGTCCLPQSRNGIPKAIKSPGFGLPQIPAGPCLELIGGSARRCSISDWGTSPTPIHFPLDNFKHSLNLFSTSFSSSHKWGIGPCLPLKMPLQTAIQKMESPDSKDGLFVLEILSMVGSWSPNTRRAVAATTKRVELQPPLATSIDVDSHLGQSRARGEQEASILPAMKAQPMIKARFKAVNHPHHHNLNILPDYSIGRNDRRQGTLHGLAMHDAMCPDCMPTCPCLSALVPWCLGGMVPWYYGAMVPWCHGALVPWCLGSMVLQCLVTMVLRCISVMVLRCHGAMVPRFLGAFVLWCHGAMCLGALMPRCMVHGAWCHGVRVPWCHGAMVPWCHGDLVHGHAFMDRIRTENQNQMRFYLSIPYEISVLVELIFRHLLYILTDVPPQPNSPPDNVFHPDRPAEQGLGPKRGEVPRFQFTK